MLLHYFLRSTPPLPHHAFQGNVAYINARVAVDGIIPFGRENQPSLVSAFTKRSQLGTSIAFKRENILSGDLTRVWRTIAYDLA